MVPLIRVVIGNDKPLVDLLYKSTSVTINESFLKVLTFRSWFVDFWRKRVARGGCFAGVFSSVKMLAIQRDIFVLCMLVYVKCFSYLCNVLMRGVTFNGERGTVRGERLIATSRWLKLLINGFNR